MNTLPRSKVSFILVVVDVDSFYLITRKCMNIKTQQSINFISYQVICSLLNNHVPLIK